MVAYTGIQGQNILIVSSDPANPTEGQIWYNSTSNLLKGYANVVTNAWASGGNLNTARDGNNNGSVGTQTAGLIAGGFVSPNSYPTATELYNGTAWTTSPATLPAGKGSGLSFGLQIAAVIAGGGNTSYSAGTEEWDGATWSSSNNMNTQRGSRVVGYGTLTAGLGAGGYNSPGGGNSVATESYNGTSWTTVNSLNTARRGAAGAGIQTAAIYFGGTTAPGNQTESWNGSSWTTVNTLNTGRDSLSGAGTQTLAIAFGGSPYRTATELWNGTSWTTNPNSMASGRQSSSQSGNYTAALAIGGRGTPGLAVTTTEEWTSQAVQVKTITTS